MDAERVVVCTICLLIFLILLRRRRIIRFLVARQALQSVDETLSFLRRRLRRLRARNNLRPFRRAWVYPCFITKTLRNFGRKKERQHLSISASWFIRTCQEKTQDCGKLYLSIRELQSREIRTRQVNCHQNLWRVYSCIASEKRWVYQVSNKRGWYAASHIQNEEHRLPNVVGAIDGCHMKIKAPTSNHEDYFNRK